MIYNNLITIIQSNDKQEHALRFCTSRYNIKRGNVLVDLISRGEMSSPNFDTKMF